MKSSILYFPSVPRSADRIRTSSINYEFSMQTSSYVRGERSPDEIPGIYVESHQENYQSSARGLLLVNRQLRAETLQRASKDYYALDLMLDRNVIWITWLRVPLRPSYLIEDLEIDIRTDNPCREKASLADNSSGRWIVFDIIDHIIMRLYAIGVKRFSTAAALNPYVLEPNACLEFANMDEVDFRGFGYDLSHIKLGEARHAPRYAIRNLQINVAPETTQACSHHLINKDFCFHPDSLCQSLVRLAGQGLHLDYVDGHLRLGEFSCLRAAWSQIGRISVNLDENVIRYYDVAEILEKDISIDERVNRWRDRMKGRRKENGLAN